MSSTCLNWLHHTRELTMKLQHDFVSFIILLLSSLCVIDGCHDEERAALLNFKSSLTDPSNRLSSWQGQNCCSWLGIQCSDSRHVIAVNLQNPNPDSFILNMNSQLVSTSDSKTSTAVNGTVSSALFTLHHLRYLDLSFNNFMFSKLPTGFSNLTRLTYLNLANAMFRDSITTQFANLTSLRWLDLSCSLKIVDKSSISYNLTSSLRVTGGFPSSYIYFGNISSSNLDWLRGLRNLRGLRLSGVDLSKASQLSKWAEPLSILPDLRLLHLSNCGVFGMVPVNQSQLYLHFLRMDFNSLTSAIPKELANLTALSVLDLSSANLHGSIPFLPQLQELYVGNNLNITINLSSMFAVPWTHLERLDIQSTQVIGSIPASFTNTTSLVQFTASNCGIHGPVLSSTANLSKLEILQLDFNYITGHLSQLLQNLNSLRLVSLMENSLDGPIPDSICKISSLQYLLLAFNSLTGRLPDCISQLTNLIYLFVSGNNLNGTIPSLMSLFHNSTPELIGLGSSGLTLKVDQSPFLPIFQPQVLELSSCDIGGGIPDFLSNLTQLAFLSLANNSLSGTIPSWLFNLPKLNYLDLSFNKLQGVLPPIIQLHSYIWYGTLNLARNRLQGHIPMEFRDIENINLSGNNFTGHIPAQIQGLGNIRYLSLSDNKLFGKIPLSLCGADNVLLLLDLSNNMLVGRIPISVGNCTSLVVLNLGGNNLSGNIPNVLKAAKDLTYLELSDNHFDGPFPSFIQKLKKLEVLMLANNRFEGKISRFIGGLKNLHILVLRSNSFNDSIPAEINKLEKLQFLDFSNNKLSGPLPEKLDGLKLLREPEDGDILGYVISSMYFGVELNMVGKGLLLQYDVVRMYHNGIDFSCNNLTGNIPLEIGLLEVLFMLNISHNSLSGMIPDSIGSMKGLESLDLSFNNLRGDIPTALTMLDALTTLNLSYNNLSGKIPAGRHFETLNEDGWAYIGNKFLSAAPDGATSGRNAASPPVTVDVENDGQNLLFYGIVILGYGVGFWGLFGVVYLMGEEWWKRYWRAIDKIALRMIKCIVRS